MAIVLDDIAVHLQTQGLGTIGSSLFKGYLPDEPDVCVAIVEISGDQPIDTMGATLGTINVDRPALQILCRAAQDDYEAARVKAESAYRALHNLVDTTVNGIRYLNITANRPPAPIDRDENSRWVIGFEIDVWKEVST